MKLKYLFGLCILMLCIFTVNAAEWDYTGINYSFYVNNVDPTGIFYYDNYWYIADEIDKGVYKYNSSWDYDSFINLSSKALNLASIYRDGDYWYLSDYGTDDIHQYDNSWNWIASYDVSAQDGTVRGAVKDGDYWYILGYVNDRVFVYNSTFSYTGTSYLLNTPSTAPIGLFKQYDYWYVSDTVADVIFKFNSTFGYTGTNYSIVTQDNTPRGIYTNNYNWYMVGVISTNVYLYDSVFVSSITTDLQEYYNVSNITTNVYYDTLNTTNVSMYYSLYPFNSSTDSLYDGLVAYYPMDDNFNDLSGNGNDGTVYNGAYVDEGKYGNSGIFDGVNDYVDIGLEDLDMDLDYSLSFWFNPYVNYGDKDILSTGHTNLYTSSLAIRYRNDESVVEYIIGNGSGGYYEVGKLSNTVFSLNNWYYYNFVRNGNIINVYVNGVLDNSQTKIDVLNLGDSWSIARRGEINTAYFNGSIDEVMIWNRALSPTEISEIYNNTKHIIKFASDNNESLTLTGFQSYDILNMTIYADNQIESIYNQFQSYFDLTAPVINHNIPSELNSYLMSGIQINISDMYPDTCIITLESTNYSCSTFSNHTFTTNGNQTYSITAVDLAGNSKTETGLIFVNPYFYIYFNDTDGNQITNFKINDIDYVNYFSDNIYNYSLGNNTFTFYKFSYATTNFTLNLNITSNINTTIIINQSIIHVRLYNRETGDVFNESVDIQIFGVINGTTSNGTIDFYNSTLFVAQDYTIKAISTGYYTNQKMFTYTGTREVYVDMYLLSTSLNNSATLTVTVYNNDNYNRVADANTKLEEYDPILQSFKDVSQCNSDSSGVCNFLIELGTKTYRISSTKTINNILYYGLTSTEGEVFQPLIYNGEIVQTGYNKILYLNAIGVSEYPDYYGFYITYPDTEEDTIVFENDSIKTLYIPVIFNSDNNMVYEVCINAYIYQNNNPSYISSICVNGSSGTPTLSNFDLDNGYDYLITITSKYSNVTTVQNTYNYKSNQSLWYVLNQSNLVNPIYFFMWTLLLGFCLSSMIILFGFLSPVLSLIQVFIFPSITNISLTVYILIMSWAIIYLSRIEVDEQ